jgi:hypothetical protein
MILIVSASCRAAPDADSAYRPRWRSDVNRELFRRSPLNRVRIDLEAVLHIASAMRRRFVLHRSVREVQTGFSLLEAIVATGLLAGGIAALGQMFAIALADTAGARAGSLGAVLAEQKIEQLRGLAWGFDALGLPVGDLSTDTALPDPSPTGGSGLSISPADSLTANTPGYVDYVDRYGRTIGGGPRPPPGTLYSRRWSIQPLPSDPVNALLIQVIVTTRFDRGGADTSGSSRRLRDEARLMTVKTRKAR